MIVSHLNRFVYVKPGKTAGSSVELTLSGYCGTDDIVSELRKRDERLRPPCRAKIANPEFKHVRTEETITLGNHVPYSNILRVFGEEIADYIVVCSERNPWEKAISSFFWKGNRRPERPEVPRFRRFVRDARPPLDFNVYALNGVPIVDFVLRVESLSADFGQLVELLGYDPNEAELVSAAKAFMRPKHATRDAFFDKPWVRRTVAEHNQELLAFLPYRFEDKIAPDYELSEERRAARYRFLEENECGAEYWQPFGD